MNPYHKMVLDYARLARDGRKLPLGEFPETPKPEIKPDAPKVLIFSPHPDDEVIIGGLALRLLREAKWNVQNVAVTLGSKKDRQPGRLAELKACCQCIGFGLIEATPGGLESVNVKTRESNQELWSRSVDIIAKILSAHRPKVILVPHELDWNSSHIGTHHLVMDALKQLGPQFGCYVVETEFWGAMANPNLMVEISPADLGDLITALTFHVGEVKRNPYHLSISAWMADNVRRGGEVVGGQGGAAPDYDFATLYRLRKWSDGRLANIYDGGRLLAASQNAGELFP
jgi:LmbE family N-acetylglucosaminyl deacetylase